MVATVVEGEPVSLKNLGETVSVAGLWRRDNEAAVEPPGDIISETVWDTTFLMAESSNTCCKKEMKISKETKTNIELTKVKDIDVISKKRYKIKVI
jgi:hypothetical protein